MSEYSVGRDDAALLLTCLNQSGKWTTIRGILGTWDMVAVDVPSRETIERAAAPLVGSGLVEVREASELRLTVQGRDLHRSVKKRGIGMREIPSAVSPVLAAALTGTIDVELSEDAYDAALKAYVRPHRKAEPSKVARRFKAVGRFFGR